MFNNVPEYHSKKSLAPDAFTEFLKGFREYEKGFLFKEKENLFLDFYSRWLKTKEEKFKLRAVRIAWELKLLGGNIELKGLFSQNINHNT